jgi:hypothetical protein
MLEPDWRKLEVVAQDRTAFQGEISKRAIADAVLPFGGDARIPVY